MWRRFFSVGYNRSKRLESESKHPNYSVFTTRPPPIPKFFAQEVGTLAAPLSLLYENVPGDLFLLESWTIGVLR